MDNPSATTENNGRHTARKFWLTQLFWIVVVQTHKCLLCYSGLHEFPTLDANNIEKLFLIKMLESLLVDGKY